MLKLRIIAPFFCLLNISLAQLPVARDTISVIENNYTLKMPWSNGLNYANFSSVDIDLDGKKDIVAFDRQNNYVKGHFRCYINKGNAGKIFYRANPDYSYFFPTVFNWATFIDYDGDNKEDLFFFENGNISVYKNMSVQNNGLSFKLVKKSLSSNYTPGGTSHFTNIYASPAGLPGLADVDNDGDIDILTFSSFGVIVEYHKNLSKETYGHQDSLNFELGENCWGKVTESNCSVDFNLCNKRSSFTPSFINQKPYHAGSCLMCFDSDGDGDKDLIMGDVACNDVQYVHNTGTPTLALFSDTTKLYPNYPSKNNTNTQVKISNFPCTYYLDVDNDNKKDLLASPNTYAGENYKSVWYYKNVSVTNTVNFQFVKNNFLQDEMIDVGQNSFPVLLDYDIDGKKDLLIGNYGYYNNGVLGARLTLYKNIGSISVPSYSLITRDYGNLSAQPNLNFAMPTIGDIDGDGDMDILIGTSSGQVHWLENTAGQGNLCNFSVFKSNPFNFTTVSAAAAPQLFDLDSDGKLDLLIGTKNGRISFYKNTGTISVPSFSLISSFLGSVDVKGDPNEYGLDGLAVPFFYNDGGVTKLLLGSVSGKIFQYNVPANFNSPFGLISNSTNNFNEGGQSTPFFEDINNDGKRDLFIGNASGGLSFYSSNSPYVALPESSFSKIDIQLSPNPCHNELFLSFSNVNFESINFNVFDLFGNELISQKISSAYSKIDVSVLNSGVYFAKVMVISRSGNYTSTKKIIVE